MIRTNGISAQRSEVTESNKNAGKNSGSAERQIICMETGTERHQSSKSCVPLTAMTGLLMYCKQASAWSWGVKSVSCSLPLVNGTKRGQHFHFRLLQKTPFESRLASFMGRLRTGSNLGLL